MITVTRATQADLDGVENIENACFGDDRFSRRQLLYLIIYAKGACFIVHENGQAKAYISLLYKNNTDNLRIYSLAVLPESRGKGFAQLLLEKSKEFAKKNALRQITLEVKTSNTSALALYQKNGFTVKNTIPTYYHDGSPAYRMVLEL